MDGPSNDYGIPHHPDRLQDVLNQSWPPNDGARGLNDHASIDVKVRVVFERDGEMWLEGVATRWSGRHVFVRVEDSRLRVQFVWVDAADVRRLKAGDSNAITRTGAP